jgi:hypothetical protein
MGRENKKPPTAKVRILRQRAATELLHLMEPAGEIVDRLRDLAVEDESIEVSALNRLEMGFGRLAYIAEAIAKDETVSKSAIPKPRRPVRRKDAE